jgi:L-fucose mutarotase/ribose pyranase (RbsD/FucU family)
MRRLFVFACLVFAGLVLALSLAASAQTPIQTNWRAKINEALPLLGHRNWIVIADSAYPQQSSAGIEVIETNADEPEVLRYVLGAVNRSIHVRPDILMDAELPFVPEADAPGVTSFRSQIEKVLGGQPVQSMPHGQLIAELDQASKGFRVLVLKTRLTVPYTSVFLRLNCKYWSDDAEKRLRAKMAGDGAGAR